MGRYEVECANSKEADSLLEYLDKILPDFIEIGKISSNNRVYLEYDDSVLDSFKKEHPFFWTKTSTAPK